MRAPRQLETYPSGSATAIVPLGNFWERTGNQWVTSRTKNSDAGTVGQLLRLFDALDQAATDGKLD